MTKKENDKDKEQKENEEIFTEDDYMEALKKASQPLPKQSDEETDKTSE
ncbi:MAG: hypothetical protein WD751_00405 [Anaerolineales bacterium]